MWKTFCVSEQGALFAPRQRRGAPDSEIWQGPVCWTDSGPLTYLARHLLSLSSASCSALLRWIWLIESTVPVCRPAISTHVHKLSVKKWLFNNVALFFSSLCPRTSRPLQGHYQWNPCLDKWRETNVLLWRKVLIVRAAARAQAGEIRSVANY